MEAVRTIVSADKLAPIINLPWVSKNLQVEVVIIPIVDKTTRQRAVSVVKLEGCLRSYANPGLWENERHAWEDNMIEKYGNI